MPRHLTIRLFQNGQCLIAIKALSNEVFNPDDLNISVRYDLENFKGRLKPIIKVTIIEDTGTDIAGFAELHSSSLKNLKHSDDGVIYFEDNEDLAICAFHKKSRNFFGYIWHKIEPYRNGGCALKVQKQYEKTSGELRIAISLEINKNNRSFLEIFRKHISEG